MTNDQKKANDQKTIIKSASQSKPQTKSPLGAWGKTKDEKKDNINQ